MRFAARFSLVLAFAAFAIPAGAAEQPTLLGSSRDWTAFTASTGEGKVCYALSRPVSSNPKKTARDPIYVLISTWPGRNIRDEVQVVPGYLYRDGEPAYAQVGSQRIEFFTRNDGKAGSAWVKEVGDESTLVSAMRSGSTLTVSGVSKRGTKTVDTYSLTGLATALDRTHSACRQ